MVIQLQVSTSRTASWVGRCPIFWCGAGTIWRRDARLLRALDRLLSGGPRCRHAVGDQAIRPRARRRARRNLRLDQPEPVRNTLRVPPRLL
jgi:hypothetical protein